MDVDVPDPGEASVNDLNSVESEVFGCPLGRHVQHSVLPSDGLDLKLEVDGEGQLQPQGDGASVPVAAAPLRSADNPDAEERCRKRRRYHRRMRPHTHRKVWQWRKELAEAAGVAGVPGTSREGSASRILSPGRIRSSGHAPAALPAPNNTNQFLMEDHTELQGLDLESQRGQQRGRTRDSSLSFDSDEELSSSPGDESYLSREFANTYEDVHIERLGTMSKLDLIQEYLQLEQKVDVLEKRLKTSNNTNSGTGDSAGNCGTGTDSDSEVADGEMPMEPAMAEKIRIFQEEIQKLVVENEQLLQENQRLQSSGSLRRHSSSSFSSSVDSESDSSTTSGSSSTSSGSGASGISRSSNPKDCGGMLSHVTASTSAECNGQTAVVGLSEQSDQVKSFEDIVTDTIHKENGLLDSQMHSDLLESQMRSEESVH